MRYLGLTEKNKEEMLSSIGVNDINQLYDLVPKEIGLKAEFNLPNHKSEIQVEKEISKLANKNKSASDRPFFLGSGCYNHHIPAVVDHVIQRSEFLTSYTPYQPEISQGTLTVIFEFQSIISALTGMEIANASMYDGATALAEAALMAIRIKKDRKNIHIAGNLHPDYKAVIENYISHFNGKIVDKPDDNTACIIIQNPDFYGEIINLEQIRKQCDEFDALMITSISEIVSLGMINPPTMSDIVAGEASSIGVAMSFGGPHLGFLSCKKEYVRQMPGRICGATKDIDGKRSFVLTLCAREQHIRREKATSNICSNQGLCATAFTIHSALLGEIGFKKLALINHKRACYLYEKLSSIKEIKIINKSFFNEITVEFKIDAKKINDELLKRDIIGGLAFDDNKIIFAVTELTSNEDIETLIKNLKEILKTN